MKSIVIIGGGASGVLLAVHLLRDRPWGLQVTIVERRRALGAGVAYATNHPDHLLNVRASNMSAFPDDPGHFLGWLGSRIPSARTYGPDDFAPRHLYRDYLNSLLTPLLTSGRLRHVQAEAMKVRADTRGIEVVCSSGRVLRGDIGVIATGNEGPSLPPEPWRFEGWDDRGAAAVAANAPIVVGGTGLTMVDRVLSLLHGGHRGPITAVSRRGLVPQVHEPDAPVATAAGQIPFGGELSRLIGWMRQGAAEAERTGSGWRGFVDGLRPHTQALWQSLPLAERRRFLRHARVFWDAHRHRIAPDAARRLDAAKTIGQLRIVAAHVIGFEPTTAGVEVHLARRRTGRRETVRAEAVFECRGRVADVIRSENPVLLDLLRSGLARPDPLGLGLGLDVADDCALTSASGRRSRWLYAIGPVTAGSFWEIVAIPDIRQQAKGLAKELLVRAK